MVSSAAQTPVANSIGRSRRKGSLARLIGILTSVSSPLKITQQAGVERFGGAKAALQHVLWVSQPGQRADRKSAQSEFIGGDKQLVLDVREGRLQHRQNLLLSHLF